MINCKTLFWTWYKTPVWFVFPYLRRLFHFSKAPWDMGKVPQKCQKIAGYQECAVYSSRPPIASAPGSSPPERPVPDNATSQVWSDATCPCTTSWSSYFRFVTLFLFEKTRQNTRSSGTGASCVGLDNIMSQPSWVNFWYYGRLVDSWYYLDRVVLEGISQVWRRSEVGNHKWRTLNAQLPSVTSAGTFAVSADPYEFNTLQVDTLALIPGLHKPYTYASSVTK